ncbi:MAG: riboflavin synthase [Kiritimatiellae bacterium]|nr:riboflavin synthase [Kiritimatiellia bacterium]
MFTGIIQKMGKITELDLKEKWGRIVIDAGAWDRPMEAGESVAVSGICLTVTRTDGPQLHFDVLRETFEKTNLGSQSVGSLMNLERALRWGDPMGGHIVIGHVDGVGEVRSIEAVGRDWRFEFACSPELMHGMVYKGSVGIDGVSLTLAEVREDSVVVHIIPFTYEHTSFGRYQRGHRVNVEVDVLGKFVRRYVERGLAYPGVDWETLRAAGLIEALQK